jgi:hypothetical protein
MEAMINKIKNKWTFTDLIFILYFSLTPFAQVLLPFNFLLEHWLPIYFVSFFIASMPYVGKLKAYIIRVVISLFLCILVAKTFLGNFHGYFFVFILVYIKILIIPATLGFITASLYKRTEDKLFKNFISNNVKNISVLSVIAVAVFFFINKTEDKDLLLNEVNKRLSLAKNIASFYGKNKTIDLNNIVAIDTGVIDGIYNRSNDGILTHGYNGKIEIVIDSYGVSLIYHDIPHEEVCHWFYFMNSPSTYGFRDIYVDEKSIKTPTNSMAMENKKKELCYSGIDVVKVRYTASYSELEKASEFIKKMDLHN